MSTSEQCCWVGGKAVPKMIEKGAELAGQAAVQGASAYGITKAQQGGEENNAAKTNAIIAAAFLMNSSPWRYCRKCGRWWNLKTGKQYNYCPDEADGIVKCRECEQCDKHA